MEQRHQYKTMSLSHRIRHQALKVISFVTKNEPLVSCGILLYRSDGMFMEAMSSARKLLTTSWDTDIALVFAAMMLCCCQDAAGQAALGSKQAVIFLCLLFQVTLPWT